MKNYVSLGELLVDYRKFNKYSQADLAAKLDVDIRTVIRWEKDITLVKSEKEKDLVEQTFIPYQVIRNLNASVPIPVFYDFKIRKYSLSEISLGIPDAETFKAHLDNVCPRVHRLSETDDPKLEIDHIMRYYQFLFKTDKPIKKKIIQEASRYLPDLSLIIYDNAGYYAGHCMIFPISNSVYQQLKNRKIDESQIKVTDMVNYQAQQNPVFYGYSMYADCNENFYYMFSSLYNFLSKCKEYIFAGLVARPDALQLLTSMGLSKIWENEDYQSGFEKEFKPVFMEGNLSKMKTN